MGKISFFPKEISQLLVSDALLGWWLVVTERIVVEWFLYYRDRGLLEEMAFFGWEDKADIFAFGIIESSLGFWVQHILAVLLIDYIGVSVTASALRLSFPQGILILVEITISRLFGVSVSIVWGLIVTRRSIILLLKVLFDAEAVSVIVRQDRRLIWLILNRLVSILIRLPYHRILVFVGSWLVVILVASIWFR